MTLLPDFVCVLAAEAGGAQAAPAREATQSPANPLISLVPFVLIIVVFFWLMSRSQKKREREYQQMLDSIKPKDDVVTRGGIHGRVVQVKDDEFVLRIDPEKDIKITIAKSGVARKLGEESPEG